MDFKKIRKIIFMLSIVVAFCGNAFSQPPPSADPRQVNIDQTLEGSQRYAKALGVPKDVIKTFASIPGVDVRTLKLEPPFFEQWFGSGVVVSTGDDTMRFVITAGHMFLPYYDLVCGTNTRVTIHFFGADVESRPVFYRNEYDEDLAVVRFPPNSAFPISPVKIAEKDPEIGEELFAVGYVPVNGIFQTVIPFRFRGTFSYETEARLAPHMFAPKNIDRFLNFGGAIQRYSGGAVLNKKGELQGIITVVYGSTFTSTVTRTQISQAIEAVRSGQDFCRP